MNVKTSPPPNPTAKLPFPDLFFSTLRGRVADIAADYHQDAIGPLSKVILFRAFALGTGPT
jgi:hypothetical protein